MIIFSSVEKFLLSWKKKSPQLRIFSSVKNFLFSWEFSRQLRILSKIENFLFSWEFSLQLRIFPSVENFLFNWELSLQLRIFYSIENFLFSWELSFSYQNSSRISHEKWCFTQRYRTSYLWLLICSKNVFLYSIKHICILYKIFVFNEKYFCPILLLLCSINKKQMRKTF